MTCNVSRPRLSTGNHVPYQLGEVRPPQPELMARVEGQFRSRSLNVV